MTKKIIIILKYLYFVYSNPRRAIKYQNSTNSRSRFLKRSKPCVTLPRSVFESHHHVERELGENRVVMLGIKEAEQG